MKKIIMISLMILLSLFAVSCSKKTEITEQTCLPGLRHVVADTIEEFGVKLANELTEDIAKMYDYTGMSDAACWEGIVVNISKRAREDKEVLVPVFNDKEVELKEIDMYFMIHFQVASLYSSSVTHYELSKEGNSWYFSVYPLSDYFTKKVKKNDIVWYIENVLKKEEELLDLAASRDVNDIEMYNIYDKYTNLELLAAKTDTVILIKESNKSAVPKKGIDTLWFLYDSKYVIAMEVAAGSITTNEAIEELVNSFTMEYVSYETAEN